MVNGKLSEEGRKRISERTRLRNLTNNPMWSDSAKKKCSESHKLYQYTDDHRKSVGIAMKKVYREASDEWKKKRGENISVSHLGVKLSVGHCAAISRAQKKRFDKTRELRDSKRYVPAKWGSDEHKRKCKEATILSMGRSDVRERISGAVKLAMKRPEVRERFLVAVRTKEYRERASEQVKKLHADGYYRSIGVSEKISATVAQYTLNGGYGKPRYEYNGSLFKSKWEVRVARWLDEIGIRWEYEPIMFRLSDGHRYIPDFLMVDKHEFLEVKGYLRSADAIAMDEFVSMGNELWLIDKSNIDNPALNKRWQDGVTNR